MSDAFNDIAYAMMRLARAVKSNVGPSPEADARIKAISVTLDADTFDAMTRSAERLSLIPRPPGTAVAETRVCGVLVKRGAQAEAYDYGTAEELLPAQRATNEAGKGAQFGAQSAPNGRQT